MAVTTENSTQMGLLLAAVPKPVAAYDWGELRRFFFDFTQGASAGDAGSIARLIKLPPGYCRLFLPSSRLWFSAMGASRTMDLGWEAYTEIDGTEIAADPNGLDDGVSVVSAGNVTPGGTLGEDETKLFNSRDGVTLTAQINDGTLPAAGEIKGWFDLVRL